VIAAALRLAAGLALGALAASPPAAARAVDQAGWNEAKRSVRLRDGLRLTYVEAGDPAGEPLVLIHGWTDTSRSFSLLVPHLAGFRLIVPDLRGHGSSDKPACCYAVGDLADDIRRLLDAKGIRRASIVGHSLGGIVAQRFAAEHPDRTARLALLASTPDPVLAPGDPLWTAVMALRAPIDPESGFMRAWVSGETPVEPALLAAVRPETAGVPIHVWRAVARELATTSAGKLAPEVTAPVLVLWGDRDAFFGPASQRRLRELHPRARYRELKGQGHNLHWEVPGVVGPVLADFLRGD